MGAATHRLLLWLAPQLCNALRRLDRASAKVVSRIITRCAYGPSWDGIDIQLCLFARFFIVLSFSALSCAHRCAAFLIISCVDCVDTCTYFEHCSARVSKGGLLLRCEYSRKLTFAFCWHGYCHAVRNMPCLL